MSGWILRALGFILLFVLLISTSFELFFRFIPIELADNYVSHLNPFYLFSNLSIIVFIIIILSLIVTVLLHWLISNFLKKNKKNV